MVTLVVGPREPDNEMFGKYLEQLRDQKGWSRKYAANKIGFSSEYLRLIERGVRVPAAGAMQEIFTAYEVPYKTDGGRRYIANAATPNEIIFEFTSRIREARTSDPSSRLKLSRSQQIGEIVQLLTVADDQTIQKIYKTLKNQ